MRIPNTAMKRDTEEIRALNNFNEKGVSAMKILVFGAGGARLQPRKQPL